MPSLTRTRALLLAVLVALLAYALSDFLPHVPSLQCALISGIVRSISPKHRPMETTTKDRLLATCAEAHQLVQGFLDDSLPETHLRNLNPPYQTSPLKRAAVKEKVLKSLEVLDTALDKHEYVIFLSISVDALLTAVSEKWLYLTMEAKTAW